VSFVSVRRQSLPAGHMRVVEAGEGPVLVYLHGVGDRGAMLPALVALADRFHVIRPDHPGFLESDELGVGSVRDIAAAQLTLLDTLGVDRFHLVGCSLGGWAATELALMAEQRIDSLTLIDPAGLAGDGSAPNTFTLPPERLLELTVHDEAGRQAARTAPADPATAALLRRNNETAERIAGSPYMHDPGLADRARRLRLPVQVFWGENDGVIPVSYADSWAEVLPEARIEIIRSAGHLPHVERPDEFLGRTFLLDPVEAA
jgi:pimeloyl-ACP methyl ester carboxylesterase